ncbi:MAG: galactokinase family protein [Melioribacteraceae bacterium]|nr:galactokinase family protein [Melioribacteraceae bacterium]
MTSPEIAFYKKLSSATKTIFEELYGDPNGGHLIIAPASLILLGDHTHYNGGILLSVALNKFVTIIIKKRTDQTINLTDANSLNSIIFQISDIDNLNEHKFRNELCLLRMLKANCQLEFGFNCVIHSEVPECLGLGALASLEVGFATALNQELNLGLNNSDLLEYVRQCELLSIGKISNIAHHYTVKFGKENKFFNIDLRSLEHKSLARKEHNFDIVIINTGERIQFVSDICNERIEECEIGVKGLRLYIWGIKNLRDVEQSFLLRHYHMLPKRIFNRILYNVNERIRSEEALKFIKKNKMEDFGKCITQSHWSISSDYELSCPKCDFLIERSSKLPGVFGSKMISCSQWRSTFHLVRSENTNSFIKNIKKKFQNEFKSEPEFYVYQISDGVKEIPIKKN